MGNPDFFVDKFSKLNILSKVDWCREIESRGYEWIRRDRRVLFPPPEFLLHPVEGLDVFDLEFHGLFSGEAHRQDREPIPGDEECRIFPNRAVPNLHFNEHRLKIERMKIFWALKVLNVPKNVLVVLAEGF